MCTRMRGTEEDFLLAVHGKADESWRGFLDREAMMLVITSATILFMACSNAEVSVFFRRRRTKHAATPVVSSLPNSCRSETVNKVTDWDVGSAGCDV